MEWIASCALTNRELGFIGVFFNQSVSSVAQSCLTLCDPMDCSTLASLSTTNFRSLLKLMSIGSVMPSTISSSVTPFSFCLQPFLASGSFPMSQFFASGSHSIGASPSASVLPENIQDWFSLGWTVYLVGTQLLLNGWGNTLNPSVLKYIPYHSLSTTHA